MIDDVIHAATAHFLTHYLSPRSPGPWTIGGVCITSRTGPGYGLPADAVIDRILLEQPAEGWSVAVQVVRRDGKLWRHRIEGYFDDADQFGLAGTRLAYLDWLRSL